MTAVLAVIALVAWIRKGAWVPRYVHAMAFVAFAIGLALGAIGQGWFLAVLFPALVYIVFVAKGGADAIRHARS